ncbi:hypothetical protein ABT187_45315 [Streptomyces sp. NPDC001817]|uniref:hypothetical protein n=1 Tax=Streptomyces sp. NPDC001817 TaxID=3154398 RepID=UPI003323D8F1
MKRTAAALGYAASAAMGATALAETVTGTLDENQAGALTVGAIGTLIFGITAHAKSRSGGTTHAGDVWFPQGNRNEHTIGYLVEKRIGKQKTLVVAKPNSKEVNEARRTVETILFDSPEERDEYLHNDVIAHDNREINEVKQSGPLEGEEDLEEMALKELDIRKKRSKERADEKKRGPSITWADMVGFDLQKEK